MLDDSENVFLLVIANMLEKLEKIKDKDNLPKGTGIPIAFDV